MDNHCSYCGWRVADCERLPCSQRRELAEFPHFCVHGVPLKQECLCCEDLYRQEREDELDGSIRDGMRGFTGGKL